MPGLLALKQIDHSAAVTDPDVDAQEAAEIDSGGES